MLQAVLCTSYLLVSGLMGTSVSAEDSLRTAVKALHRKQRDISLYQNPYLLGNGQPEDIGYGFQKSIGPNSLGVFDAGPLPQSELGAYDGADNNALEKLILDYLQEEEEAERYSRYPGSKRSVFRENSAYPVDALQALWNEQERDDGGSAFRERNGNGKWRLRKAHALVRNFGGMNDQQVAQEDALNVLNSIWEKYRSEEPEQEDQEPKSLYEYAYPGGEEDKKKRQYSNGYSNGYDFFNSPFSWTKRSDDYTRDEDVGRLLFAPRYGSRKYEDSAAFDDRSLDKRYPIAKRSTNHQHKRNSAEQTDPKIQQEISDIFSPHKENSTEKSPATQVASVTATSAPPKNDTKKEERKDHGQKELSTGNALDRPLDVKKKSIRWNDYFGVDKRKKKSAGYPAAGDDWLVDQYMKAAYGNRYPLYDKPKRLRGDDMDTKLRAMEDLIVDQAIKYTGAHEGATDPNEMEEVKDQVMGQLAAAYSLEKMRRALGEFRNSIQQQTLTKPHHHLQQPLPPVAAASEASKTEVKTKTRPTAQAKLEKKNDQTKDNLVNTSPYEEMEREEDCPVLDVMVERCSVASAAALDKEAAFLPLCVLHQICDQCGEGDNCDVTFLRESGRSCGGDGPCRLTSRRILDAVHSLRPEPLACRHPCLASFLAKRR